MHTTCSKSVSVMYIHYNRQVSVWYIGYMDSNSVTVVYQSRLVFGRATIRSGKPSWYAPATR